MSDAHSTDFAKQLELAWAAGFFDGEGCTHLSKYERYGKPHCYVTMTVVQVERQNLERWQRAVGAGTIGGKRRHKLSTKPFYSLTVSSSRVPRVLELMWPYLGEAKKHQAEECLRVGKVGRSRVSERECCVNGHPYTPDNIYLTVRGRVRCKVCVKAADLRARLKKRAKKHEHLRPDDAGDDRKDSESHE